MAAKSGLRGVDVGRASVDRARALAADEADAGVPVGATHIDRSERRRALLYSDPERRRAPTRLRLRVEEDAARRTPPATA
jgi:hypothetical protein